jgi:hypothetical protein
MILRRLAMLVGLTGLALVICYAWIGSLQPGETGKVYTLSELEARLARVPGSWLARPLRVWALAQPCPTAGSPHAALHCLTFKPVLVDPDDMSLTAPLPLADAPGNSFHDLLSNVPLIGSLLPLQAVRWDRPAVYRLRLLAPPAGTCADPGCYTAVLLDGVPISG